jgi:shikimate kinase
MNLYLIGPRGSGKSTVAPRVAQLLNRPLFSSDAWTECQSGKSISEIFAQDGESRFREWETEAIRVAAQGAPSVVDLGGGAVLRAENRVVLTQGAVVWCSLPPRFCGNG